MKSALTPKYYHFLLKKNLFLAILGLVVFNSFAQSSIDPSFNEVNIQVKTLNGIVEGSLEKSGIIAFKGIPYAMPPLGSLRWKAPQPINSWTGIKECKVFANNPIQAAPEPFYMWSEEFLIPKASISEDCLYLNVWTGAKLQKEKRPVIVWIHGGGFNSGSGSVPIYDGEALAKKGVILVNINYRLGIFGFFAHPELSKEAPSKTSGNYGLMDQIAALQWVKKNIAAFGGNPENITIAGQSAGSVSVACLVASPLAKGLFQKAIAQSGAGLLSREPAVNFESFPNLAQTEQEGVRIAQECKVTSLNELRKMPADELFNKVRFRPHPIIDKYVIPENMAQIYKGNIENNIALLTGWNEDEGIVIGKFKTATEFKADLEKRFGPLAKGFLQHYPAFNDDEAAHSQSKFERDIVFGAQNYTLANVVSNQKKKVYVYRFTRKVPATGQYINFGAFHTGEVPYMFNNLNFVNRPWVAVDFQLADTMSSYWVNFAASGNPNGKGLSSWSPYKTTSKKIIKLGDKVEPQKIPDALSLDFFYDELFLKK